jgi:hypothetical protein
MIAAIATSVGLLPERIDVTHIFATYGAGAMLGEVVAARRGLLDPATSMRRFGVAATFGAALAWTLALIAGLR